MKVRILQPGAFNMFQYKGERTPCDIELSEFQVKILESQNIAYEIVEEIRRVKLPRVVADEKKERQQMVQNKKNKNSKNDETTSKNV